MRFSLFAAFAFSLFNPLAAQAERHKLFDTRLLRTRECVLSIEQLAPQSKAGYQSNIKVRLNDYLTQSFDENRRIQNIYYSKLEGLSLGAKVAAQSQTTHSFFVSPSLNSDPAKTRDSLFEEQSLESLLLDAATSQPVDPKSSFVLRLEKSNSGIRNLLYRVKIAHLADKIETLYYRGQLVCSDI